MEAFIEFVIGAVVLLIAFFVMYMSVHINEEERAKKHLALPWEDFKEFTKWFTGKNK